MRNKRNVLLYLDKDLVEKTRELGFNPSKYFENTLKQLISSYSSVNSKKQRKQLQLWCFGAVAGARTRDRKLGRLVS